MNTTLALPAQAALVQHIRAWFAPWTYVPVEPHVALPGSGETVTALLTFPMGWRVAHVLQWEWAAPEMLNARTRAYERAGFDVVWWLGGGASTQALRDWMLDRWGWFTCVDTTSQPAMYALSDWEMEHKDDPRRAGWPAPMPRLVEPYYQDDITNVYLDRWRRLALRRYLECWRQGRVPQMVRGLAGTPNLARSLAGIVGAANGKTIYKAPDGAWCAIHPARPSVFAWPPEAIAVARQVAYTLAESRKQIRNA